MTTNYEKDPHQWALEQAQFLRLGDLAKLDIEHLVEEVEALSNSDKRAVESYLANILLHMLKQKYQPNKKTRSWELSIKASRTKANRLIKKNPSFKRFLSEWLLDAYEDAVIGASAETGLEEKVFPIKCPWSIEEALNV